MSTKKLNPKDPNAKPTMHESMFWTNASGFIVAAALALASGAHFPSPSLRIIVSSNRSITVIIMYVFG